MMRVPVVLFYVLLFMSEDLAVSIKPRMSFFFNNTSHKHFKDSGQGNLSSIVLRDDIGQLVLGATEKVFTLSLADITSKTGEVEWEASTKEKSLCAMKGKSFGVCKNFIKVLHTMDDGRMLVCGTNAFNPLCTHMTFTDGSFSLEQFTNTGKGKVPYNPHHSLASLMHRSTLYSATASNFLGTEMVFQKHGTTVKSEVQWFQDPNMISINLLEATDTEEDDNLFLFFTEKAIEECCSDIPVSRIARVCKNDSGGKSLLQQRWTSFLKARLDCPFGNLGSSNLVKDVFLMQDENNSGDSIFYAIFTSTSKSSEDCSKSAVCAYKVSEISQVFQGKFLYQTNDGSWALYKGRVPSPHPGSCINKQSRAQGVMSSQDFKDTTLQFVRAHPLLMGRVTPITGKPVLVQSSGRYSKIVVDRMTSLDGQQHEVMFIGTESGWLQKAVKFDGESGRIIEELQLFQDGQPVNFLQLSSKMLYSGGIDTVVQVDLRDCSRYTTCYNCILARDPYCGWDCNADKCASVAGASNSTMIQSLTDGDISSCQTSDVQKRPAVVDFIVDVPQFLQCSPDTNLPTSWRFSDTVLYSSSRHTLVSRGLVIKPSFSDAGLYTCETVESVKGREHRRTVIQYLVKVQGKPSYIAITLMSTFCGFLVVCFVIIMLILRSKRKKHIEPAHQFVLEEEYL